MSFSTSIACGLFSGSDAPANPADANDFQAIGLRMLTSSHRTFSVCDPKSAVMEPRRHSFHSCTSWISSWIGQSELRFVRFVDYFPNRSL